MGLVWIDDAELPHVLRIEMSETNLVHRKPLTNSVPWLRVFGSNGLAFAIEGWTDSLTDLGTIRRLNDENSHRLAVPLLTCYKDVIVTIASTPTNADENGVYQYALTIRETD